MKITGRRHNCAKTNFGRSLLCSSPALPQGLLPGLLQGLRSSPALLQGLPKDYSQVFSRVCAAPHDCSKDCFQIFSRDCLAPQPCHKDCSQVISKDPPCCQEPSCRLFSSEYLQRLRDKMNPPNPPSRIPTSNSHSQRLSVPARPPESTLAPSAPPTDRPSWIVS